MNKLLDRQVQKYLGGLLPNDDEFKKLLNAISETYDHYEKDRKLIERSIELSSKEMIDLNSELRREKEELRKAHKELKTLFENINEVLFTVDMNAYKLIQISAGCEKIYGYTTGEFFDDVNLWQKVVHPDDIHILNQQVNDLREGKQIVNQYRIIHKDNSIRWIENKIIPTLDATGKLIRIDGVTNDISARKKADLELEKSFSVIEATLESTADGILVVDFNGRIVRYNKKFLQLWQIPEDIVSSGDDSKSIAFVLGQLLDPEEFTKKVNDLYDNKGKVDFDYIHFKDGRVFERYSQPQMIKGVFVGRVWSFRDVTEHRRTEEKIRDSEKKLKLIMNSALDAIICIDRKGNISFWNPQAERIFGWKESEVMGKRLSGVIIPPAYRDLHDRGLDNYLKTGSAPALNVLLELSAMKRDGELFPIELTVLPIGHGEEEFFCAFIRDITERKKSETAILASNERYNLVAKATSDVIWDWDMKSNKVVRTGENMKKILGYDIDPANENSSFWMDLIHPEDRGKIIEEFQSVFTNQEEVYMESEYRIKKANGEYAYIYDKGYIVRNNKGEAIRMIGASQDITRLKENELQLQRHAKQLATSNEELERFAYIASHDLQEPLRMVTSFLTQLHKKYGNTLDEKGKKYIDFAVDGAKRMRQIILDLLEYSRAGRTMETVEYVDIRELIYEVQILHRKKIEENQAEIVFDNLPKVFGYSSPLRQVFQNLISNALKYSRQDIPPVIEISACQTEHSWQFSVKDNGIGIKPEYFDKIFIIFQRLHGKDEYSGTGIGLAVCKKIIESMGGKIWLSSEEGQGTTFYFTLPKVDLKEN